MVSVKSWMFPSYYMDYSGAFHVTFLTADGRRHRRKLYQTRDGLYKFRFNGSTWSTGYKVLGIAQTGSSGFYHSY